MYRGAIVKGSSFYLDENKNLKVNVLLNHKGEEKMLEMLVKYEDNLKLQALINDIYKYNFED